MLSLQTGVDIEEIQINYIIILDTCPYAIRFEDLQSSISPDYIFVGLKSIINTAFRIKYFGIDSDKLTCEGAKCQDKCTTIAQCGKNGGIYKDRVCTNCGGDQKFINGRCIMACGNNEIV